MKPSASLRFVPQGASTPGSHCHLEPLCAKERAVSNNAIGSSPRRAFIDSMILFDEVVQIFDQTHVDVRRVDGAHVD
jgi:hypothetical protein